MASSRVLYPQLKNIVYDAMSNLGPVILKKTMKAKYSLGHLFHVIPFNIMW